MKPPDAFQAYQHETGPPSICPFNLPDWGILSPQQLSIIKLLGPHRYCCRMRHGVRNNVPRPTGESPCRFILQINGSYGGIYRRRNSWFPEETTRESTRHFQTWLHSFYPPSWVCRLWQPITTTSCLDRQQPPSVSTRPTRPWTASASPKPLAVQAICTISRPPRESMLSISSSTPRRGLA